MAGTTSVSICNLALANIGSAASIASLTENSKEALHCNRAYDHCLRLVLRAHDWHFATGYYTLNNLGSPPADWSYRYGYPTDCERARELQKDAPTDDPIPFEVAAGATTSTRVILTDRASAVLIYTRYMDDPVAYPADFVIMLSWAISMHVAMPLTLDASVQQAAMQTYGVFSAHATANDANDGYTRLRRTPDWIANR